MTVFQMNVKKIGSLLAEKDDQVNLEHQVAIVTPLSFVSHALRNKMK